MGGVNLIRVSLRRFKYYITVWGHEVGCPLLRGTRSELRSPLASSSRLQVVVGFKEALEHFGEALEHFGEAVKHFGEAVEHFGEAVTTF